MSAGRIENMSTTTRTPVLLFDIMDTIVKDPFYKTMPEFFNMEFKELLDAKHPNTWIEFEKGLITEEQLFQNFFKDGRPFDTTGLIKAVVDAYEYIEGMQDLLQRLKRSGYEIHAFSNYPMWFMYIENKLDLQRYLQWTFVSCQGPMKGHRKPSNESYSAVIDHFLSKHGGTHVDVLFIDDRKVNVEKAVEMGIKGVVFNGDAKELEDILIHTHKLVF